ncbi:damage-inducible protein [Pseudomonas daroniae]|uniref:Damage-inducible protein n=1 Tax=Phytopseudomonas daroniae TaxID=2487519 RepID=A0A4Q9QF20_9GAMM|nr:MULTISPECIES: type ISP restriction/modification enzyme [Pseudomonas]TBU71232.1 damage-inducible protein [Pseudomonas daroniae]TBU73829.1 damage-inducible protein [Pseudomonas sp. FRB 228]TBU86401.1 damage-inducible protein [Pseudomonas daroniae]
MTALLQLLDHYRGAALTEREKGTYFEQLVKAYLLNEPSYIDLFNGQVFLWEEWRKYWMQHGHLDPGTDAGIDLVAIEAVAQNPRIFAIQAKFYEAGATLRKGDGIDSFLSAMGKSPYTDGLLVLTTSQASEHVTALVQGRDKPVITVLLSDLESSQIDWTQYQPKQAVALKPKKKLREHQQTALNAVVAGLQTADRGKLIMACGTGKTFTSLKIAEKLAGRGKRVLFLVPSLSLLSQTLTEWTQESHTPLHSFAVCSDSDVGKKRKADDDSMQVFTHELRYPATTKDHRLAAEMLKRHDDQHMSVVFSTYHSIDVISRAQHDHGLTQFDLVICDEAHRTTGATFGNDDESNFVRIHDARDILATKRLYMTATPRIYGDNAKIKAESDDVTLCSMDDPALYGKELFVINFSEAVKRGLLVDYKVLVLAVEENAINRRLQELLKDGNNQLKVDDAAKIVGCWKALAKQGLTEQLEGDGQPMQRAVAFCQVISPNYKGSKHKVSSTNIADMFEKVVNAYQASEKIDPASRLICEAEHVDGGMNAGQKEAKLTWLKEQPPTNTCRILSNVRCLSEGVDVPALDAVLFLTPRNSQVDVVQSVGRVMRTAPGKKRGYVVLPVVIPSGMTPHEALNDNQVYKVVWQVLQALRSHDDSFDATINKLDLNGPDPRKMEVIAITDKVEKKPKRGSSSFGAGKGQYGIGESRSRYDAEGQMTQQNEMAYEVGEIERAIYAKIVDKVGNRQHWEDWAGDIAKIANTHIGRIRAILDTPGNTEEIAAFERFAEELRDDLNDSISDGEIVEMLAQHLITKPVFDALFEQYSFTRNNPMSRAMQTVLDALQQHHLGKEADTLQSFYDSVKLRAAGIDNAAGKQKIVVELYDKFFRNAFPKMTDRLGIVYTPVEVVDFIIHSVNDLLKSEFGVSLGNKGVHILDPFTGTGTFITRLMQSGLISPEQLRDKYRNEIHANELVLLAYYIAAINIETTYHDIVGGDYVPFEGICLTDTFQMYEKDDLVNNVLVDNSTRRKRQKDLDIRVIIGNPPYSVGQGDANANNQNIAYPHLDRRIRDTYAAMSTATNKNALYDSYIRAIRWASDRLQNSGIIGFVTNAGFLEANTAAGLRRCLADEFSSLHVFHLRGNQRTSGELSRKEGGKIFGSGSRAPIAISLLVKNPDAKEHGRIFFHDIGDYLSREEKLEKINAYRSVAGVESSTWQAITPNEHGDWLKQRNSSFKELITLGDKKGNETTIFGNYSSGVKTQRDAWAYNSSKSSLVLNMSRMINFYNSEVLRYLGAHKSHDKKELESELDRFIDSDPTKISWTRALKNDLSKGRNYPFKQDSLTPSLYRPFTKQWLYYDRRFNEMIYQMPRIFPNAVSENRIISIKQRNNNDSQFALMTDHIMELQSDGGTQCFPMYLFEPASQRASEPASQRASEPASQRASEPASQRASEPASQRASEPGLCSVSPSAQDRSSEKSHDLHHSNGRPQRLLGTDDRYPTEPARVGYGSMLPDVSLRRGGSEMREPTTGDLFDTSPAEQPQDKPRQLTRRDGITDEGLAHFQSAYPNESLSKEDLFYYIYGLLHSPDYRERYADNLNKELPRIPRVKTARDFWAFSQAGRELGELHVNYEDVPMYPGAKIDTGNNSLTDADYRVEKMKYGKNKDLTTLHYNNKITVTGIPLEAYDYVVNGKPALDWVVERQSVRVDKASGIVSDANDWATETMGNPKYPLELFLRVITVSLETLRIVRSLPKLDID